MKMDRLSGTRSVAQGFLQIPGVDFDEIFALDIKHFGHFSASGTSIR